MNLLCKNKEDLEKIQSSIQKGTYTVSVWANYEYPLRYPCIVIPILTDLSLNDNTISRIPQSINFTQTLKFGYVYLDELKPAQFDQDMKELLK